MMIDFTKMHGLGNDYLFIDHWDGDEASLARWTTDVSDRHRGIGSDGVILVTPSISDSVDLDVEIVNADGSGAELCCNGLRCAMRWARDRGIVAGPSMRAMTGAGVVEGVVGDDGGVTLHLPPPAFGPEATGAIGLAGHPTPVALDDEPVELRLVSTGNPHAISFGTDPHTAIERVMPLVNGHATFPSGINVHAASVISPTRIDAVHCERGAGRTQSCGSGAVAVAAAAIGAGWCDRTVEVHQPGGTLTITWPAPDQPIQLLGPTEYVFSGTIAPIGEDVNRETTCH